MARPAYARRSRRPFNARPLKRRRVMRRRSAGYMSTRRPGIPRTPKMTFKRTMFIYNWTMATTTTNDFWRYFEPNLSDLPDLSQYQDIFDEYKINAFKYTFRPRYDTTTSGNSSSIPQAYAHIIKDPGSTVSPSGLYGSATLNSFLANGNVKSYTLNRPFSVYMKPRVYQEMSASTTGLQLAKPRFFRIGDTLIRHRGFHIMLQQNNFGTVNTQVQLDVYLTLYLTMRGAR